MNDLLNIQKRNNGEQQGFDRSVLHPNVKSMLNEYEHGKPIGEPSRSGNDKLNEVFAWKRTFTYTWTGLPNAGKTQFFNFMALVKSIHDDWKWAIWSPEQLGSEKQDGRVRINANDIYDDLIFSLKGVTPYKHMAEKYKLPRLDLADYMEAIEWIKQRFVVFDPPERRYRVLIDNFKWAYEKFGFDGFLIDPFKNLKDDNSGLTTDKYLDDVFSDIKEFAIDTNSVFNIIAHPKSDKDYRNKDGSYRVVTQRDLLGGSAWDNNMDGIFSIYRPNAHKNIQDPAVHFYNLKMRKQNLVAKRGVYEEISFDYRTNRYYFEHKCPIDGQKSIEFKETENIDPYEHPEAPF